ncbi:predicted protein [Postia placenta Mad-698-R]|uniref:Peptidase A1 domain-containing protein n=1 Tax=Postia placenta MAD-698-R-SB12 TaxID=670580 RepID=A0A1X6MY72_9APHY|nr:hypothetical protein POSPLADRAFT_1146264 [Postia placenta MAD-698-R-SB12]EED81734.1 predicted protein [Postia placenta Mad-698-R]OSX61321.1 hypothetical protein POSPLADRAFT_1146264 [Postia placenta MAD-698-R-SB12]
MFSALVASTSALRVPVILDTGSPDFWISTNVTFENAINTSVISGTNYGTKGGQSRVSGYILTAEAEFGGFTVHNQTFVDVTNMTTEDGTGLLFPGSLSKAKSPYNGSRPVSNIFAQYPYFPPQFTMLFSRYYGNNITSSGGEFTFGDPISGYEYIEDAPAMPVIDNFLFEQPTGAKNLTAILDAGTPTALMDSEFVDMLYALLLGDSFLRNVYTLYNHNPNRNWGNTTRPYVQMIPLTDPNEAWANFENWNQQRLDSWKNISSIVNNYDSSDNSSDSSNDAKVSTGAHLAGDVTDSTPASSSSPDFSTLTRNSYIILGLLAGVLVLVLVVLGVSCAGQRSKTGQGYRVVAPMGEQKTFVSSYSE